MKDLRSQLQARFGTSDPQPQASAPPAPADPLGPEAHLDTPWLSELRACARLVSGIQIPTSPKLATARQLTDQVSKGLSRAGRKRERKALLAARQKYLSSREKLAWTRVKSRFSTLDLSQRGYRALKQAKADPERILARLARTDDAELRGMGHAALRELLG